MRATFRWLGCVFATGLAGCSLYPIPDDVTSIGTEDIIRHARCEIRSAVIDYVIQEQLIAPSITEDEIIAFVKATEAKVKKWQQFNIANPPQRRIDINKRLSPTERDMSTLSGVAIVYTFDFNITENNRADGSAAFKLPFTSPKVLDAGASASLNLTRQGQRTFSAQDRWGDMITKPERCKEGYPQHKNLVYPLEGSIGVGRVVRTFMDITKQGGAKDSFVDTLIFTTQIGAGAGAGIKLESVPHSFRLVSATANLSASRQDIHKMVASLVFPRNRPEAITGVQRFDGDLNAPFDRPEDWRARYNLCVADARAREDQFKLLRLEAPEVYCITYADNFAPNYGPSPQQPAQPAFMPRTSPVPPPPPVDRGGRRPNRV
jgi:hypothetical protein